MRDWAREGALGFSVFIGKRPSSSVVRPSHWDASPGGGRRMSGVVSWSCGLAAVSVRQATGPKSSRVGHIHSREWVCPAGGRGGVWWGALSPVGGSQGAQVRLECGGSGFGGSGCSRGVPCAVLGHKEGPHPDRLSRRRPQLSKSVPNVPRTGGISDYLLSHQSSHLLAHFAVRSRRSRISRMARVGFCSS